MPDDIAAGIGDRGGRAHPGPERRVPERPVTERQEPQPSGLERVAYVLLLAFAGAPLFSIFAAELLLSVIALLWLIIVIRRGEAIAVPAMFWPLYAFGACTL